MSHVLIAPDKFKGSLTAPQVAAHIATGLLRGHPGIDVTEVPVADGGDGTLDAVIAAGYRRIDVAASGPTGAPVSSAFAERDGVAVVELADVSGLGRLPGGDLAPLTATSFGTGEVIKAALDAGCSTVVLGLGGSACTDGGAGMLQALGARLLDSAGRELRPGGAALIELDRVELTGLHPGVAATEIVVASDVNNPLLGTDGAAAVYGPQKGANARQVRELDAALSRFAEVLARDAGASSEVVAARGAGAAGGVGFAAMAVLGATIRPGIEYLLDLIGFPERLRGARLVITGEGSLDKQTLHGKAPAGVAKAAQQAGVPVAAVAGRCTLSTAALRDAGFLAAFALTDIEPDEQRCITEAGPLLERLAAADIAAIIDTRADNEGAVTQP